MTTRAEEKVRAARLARIQHRGNLDCISCGQPMCGIHSYTIREVCTPCGGSHISATDEAQREAA